MRKIKDSGIAWIDEMPHTWETARVKYLCSSSKVLPITKENLIENDTHPPYEQFFSIREFL